MSDEKVQSTRLSVNINQETKAQLLYLTTLSGESHTLTVAKAIMAYHYLLGQQRAGNEVTIYDPKDRTYREVTFL